MEIYLQYGRNEFKLTIDVNNSECILINYKY